MLISLASVVYGAEVSTKKISSTMSVTSLEFWSGRTLCSPAVRIRPFHHSLIQSRGKQDTMCADCTTTRQSSCTLVAMRTSISKSYMASRTTMPATRTRSRGLEARFHLAIYSNIFCRKWLQKRRRRSSTILTVPGAMEKTSWTPLLEIFINGKVSVNTVLLDASSELANVDIIDSLACKHASIPGLWSDRRSL